MDQEIDFKRNRIPGLVIFYGAFCGLVFSFNLWLGNFISYLAVLTQLFFVILICLLYIRAYKRTIGEELKIGTALITTFAVFLIGLLIFNFFRDPDSSIKYSEHGRQELLLQWLGCAALLAVINSLVILPINRMIEARKSKSK